MTRCRKGTRKCSYTGACVKKSKSRRRLSRCKRGFRQCIDKKCHKK